MTVFFFIVLGSRPVVRRGAGLVRGYCPNCTGLRSFQEATWQNYFTLFFIPLFPLGQPKAGYACASCGAPLRRQGVDGAQPEEEVEHEHGLSLPPGESLILQCPRCDGRMRAPLRERGFTATCPHCAMEFTVKGQREPIPEAEIEE